MKKLEINRLYCKSNGLLHIEVETGEVIEINVKNQSLTNEFLDKLTDESYERLFVVLAHYNQYFSLY